MERRPLGTTGLRISVIGFGCGAVGGILLKGSATERARAVARAVDLGVNYFDTAAAYGNGLSETNLALALKDTRAQAIVGTKIRLLPEDMNDIEAAVPRLVDESLRRLGRDSVNLMQLHNPVGTARAEQPGWVSVTDVMRVLDSFARLRDAGKIGFWGINGLGDVDAVHACLRGEIHSVQVCHSLLNPTAGLAPVNGFPFVDQRRLIAECAAKGIGVLAFRVLAGGALSGTVQRHANATTLVETIFSSGSYDFDVKLARRLLPLVDAGHAADLVEAAIRFAVGTPGVTSAVLGMSTIRQLEDATETTEHGPLPAAALAFLAGQWARFGTG